MYSSGIMQHVLCAHICTCIHECVFTCPQGAAAYPENEDQQQRLREAAEGLRVATNAAAQNAIKKKLVNRLEVSHRSQRALIFLLSFSFQQIYHISCPDVPFLLAFTFVVKTQYRCSRNKRRA